ncbi:MAG: amidohydrolase/deacetylase family metallohydrolase [Bryobacterales bacterium]|nr:amidohydrolase/deacetylase family metallohydrolase [Bryobacterales bacterium]
MLSKISFFLLAAAFTATAQPYDLVLRGGHVIDPKNQVDRVADVAIRDGRIAAVAPGLDVSQARRVIDVSGLYVTPGLVDIHVHVFPGLENGGILGGASSVFPDQVGPRMATTTMVDAGTAGWRNFARYRRDIIDQSRIRVLAMINITGVGMPNFDVEQNPYDLDPEATAKVAKAHKDVVVGIKTAHWRPPTFLSVEKAVEAGNLAGVPVMVDFGYFLPERPYQEMVSRILRPGDMSTHFYRWPAPLMDENGKVAEYLHAARKRGVKFDVGHGSGSFHFRLAEPVVRQGFWPDSISTDLHVSSMNSGMIDILSLMSKFMAMGVPLQEVVRMSTTNPATQINRPELGQIAVGAEADVVVLRLEKGKFGFTDARGGRIEGAERLTCDMTIRAGRVMFDYNGRAGAPWRELKIRYPDR